MDFIETPRLSNELPNLAIYGSHNATVVLGFKGQILEVIEFERLLNSKNVGYVQYLPAQSRAYMHEIIKQYIYDKYGFDEFGVVLHQHCDSNDDVFTQNVELFEYNALFPAHVHHSMQHHAAHAAGAFYQSNFEKAIAISFDGGGNDGWFNIYECDRHNGVKCIHTDHDIDLGFAYMIFGEYIQDIQKEPALNLGNLVYAGKILGYQSYGTPKEEWYEPVMEFYLSKPAGTNYESLMNKLGQKIGLVFDVNNRLTGPDAANLVATSQKVFEDIFFEKTRKFLLAYDYPICLSGGCALNIVLNTKIRERFKRPVFVGPNPNDCGIAVGMMLQCMKPCYAYDVSYLGIEVLDQQMLPRYIEHRSGRKGSVGKIVDALVQNKIIGVVQGRSEHGPRALGNRSIICSPINPDMKDILNHKVKHREWFRPFAPIVRLQDVSKYFEWEGSSEYMSFCPKVREEYREKLPSITHIDGTARVQTITHDKNSLMYDVLTEFERQTGMGVIINTSFNVNGKPLVSSYMDAFEVYDKTELDCLYLDGWFFSK